MNDHVIHYFLQSCNPGVPHPIELLEGFPFKLPARLTQQACIWSVQSRNPLTPTHSLHIAPHNTFLVETYDAISDAGLRFIY